MKPKTLASVSCLLVVLTGCADRPTTAPGPTIRPQAVLTDALARAYEFDTVHEEFSMSVSAGGEEFTFTGSADVDNAHQGASMRMDLGLLGGTMDMVVADGLVYMRSPMMGAGVDTPWVSMDLAKLNPVAAAQFGGGMGGMTDASSYAALLAGVVDAREEGHEVVGGVDTTQYVGTVDVVKGSEALAHIVGEELGADSEGQLEEAMLRLKLLGLRTRPFEAWVDGDGLLRRERFSMDMGMLPGAEGARMEMTLDLSGYGEPVDIVVPSRSKVTDVTELIEAQGGGSAG